MTVPVTTSTFSKDLSVAGMHLLNQAENITARITFLPLQPTSVSDLKSFMTKHALTELIILDQKVSDIENIARRMDWGYLYESEGLKIKVLDHHVDDPEFQHLSTGNLVLRYLQSEAVPNNNVAICLTHKDCDSLLSALMMSGDLSAREEFGQAVLAADHSAEANPIADLLQAVEESSKAQSVVTSEQFIFSVKALGALLTNRKMDSRAVELFNARVAARSAWQEKISQFTALPNGTFYYVFPERVSHDPCPEFIPPLLPQAQVILVFHNDPQNPEFMQLRAIMGLAAKPQVAIDHSGLIKPVVPGFGGRVDAGSNRRSNISIKDPVATALAIDFNLGIITEA